MNLKNMKVLHIISGELNKGAARGALWLHEEMLMQGIDSILFHTGSRFWNSKKKSITNEQSNIKYIFTKIVLRLWSKYLDLRYPKNSGELFSTGKGLISLTDLEKKFNPDVIHLHWINHYFIKYSSIRDVKTKVVWTLRDMWPFTGGCHYAIGCDRYFKSCGLCPLLGSNNETDLSAAIYKRKKRFFPENVHFIGISEWILREFEKSRLNSSKATFIPNAIHTSEWFPSDKMQKIIDFAGGRKTILVGAVNLSARYKGADYIQQVSKQLDASKFCLVIFGNTKQNFLDRINLDTLNLGVINSNNELRRIYSSCDVYLFPSLIEAFGKTVLESILCGTPVVCFDNSGPSEIVQHNQTGYLCKSFDTHSLVKGIKASASLSISQDMLDDITHYYSVSRIVKEIKQLYQTL